MRPTNKAFEDVHDFDDRALPEIEVDVVASVDGLEQIVQEGKVELEEFIDDNCVGDLEAFVVENSLCQLTEVSIWFFFILSDCLFVESGQHHLVIYFYLGSVVKILTNCMSLNALIDTNQVIVKILYRLRCENVQEFFDPKLILIEDIIKGQSNNDLSYSRPDIADMMPIVEEGFEETREEVKDLRLQVVFSLHVPLQPEDAFLDSVEDVLDDDFVVCCVVRDMKVLCEDSDEG